MRLFINSKEIQKNTIKITKENVHHLKNVIRKKNGDTLDIVIDQSHCQTIQILNIDKESLQFKKLHDNPTPTPQISITIAQGLPKQDKFSEILRANTEIGIQEFIPLITDRVEKGVIEKAYKKNERWKTVINSAATQSQRLTIPNLSTPKTIEELIENQTNQNLIIVCWEDEQNTTLKDCLIQNKNIESILLIIGPEAGLTSKEITQLKKSNAKSVKLTENILRTEHAGFYTASQIFYHYL